MPKKDDSFRILACKMTIFIITVLHVLHILHFRILLHI